jgi:hypothetical protein
LVSLKHLRNHLVRQVVDDRPYPGVKDNALPYGFRFAAHTKLERILTRRGIQRFDAQEDFRNALTFECFAHDKVKYRIVASRLKVCGTALLMKQMVAAIASEP